MVGFDSQITFCYTDNLERTAEWYQRVLGLEPVIEQERCRIFRVTAHSFFGVCERHSVGINHDDIILTFVTDEVDAWYDRLRSRGAIVSGEPVINETFNIYHFFARDPNGYQIEIQKFLLPEARDICHQTER